MKNQNIPVGFTASALSRPHPAPLSGLTAGQIEGLVPRPSTAYENASGHLQESINFLRSAVAELEERLQPILTPLAADDGSAKCCPPDSAYSPVVGSIHDRADEIGQLGVRVQCLVSRLEV